MYFHRFLEINIIIINTIKVVYCFQENYNDNFLYFMIYYVFPAVLLVERDSKDLIASSIQEAWAAKFKDSNIGYTSYDKIYGGFREKIFGIF